MSLSWLGLLLSFVLPPCLFAAAYFFRVRGERLDGWRLAALTAFCALLSALAAVVLAFYVSPQWREGARIVWTQVRADGAPLTVGGGADETVVGWPRSESGESKVGPSLTVTPAAGGGATLVISGGDGFITDRESGEVLNGEPVAVGESKQLGDYKLRVNHLGWKVFHPLTRQIEVLTASNEVIGGFDLREDRTRPLQYLLAPHVSPSLFEKQRVAEREKLEAWAAGLWLLRTDSRRVYVLDRANRKERALPPSARLSLVARWASLNLPFTLTAEGQGAALSFRPPWRFAVALPRPGMKVCPDSPDAAGGEVKLALTSHPIPCEVAMSLPFGPRAGEVRQVLTLDPQARRFTGPGSAAAASENCQPGMRCPEAEAGREGLAVRQGPYTFNLAIAEDMPRFWPCVLMLACAFAFLVWGLWLAHERMPLTNAWVVFGVVLVLWDLLCFRLLLAFRYALDPAALDALAVSGVTRAFFALLVVPGFLLLLARLRSDHNEKPPEPADAARAFRRAFAYLLALWLVGFSLSLFGTSRLVWHELPDSYHTLSLSLPWSSLGGALVYAGVFWLAPLLLLTVYMVYLYSPGDAEESVFLKPWKRWGAEKAEASPEEDEEAADWDGGGWDEEAELRPPAPSQPAEAAPGLWKGPIREFFILVRRLGAVALLLFSPWRWAEEAYLPTVKRPDNWGRVLRSWGGLFWYLVLFSCRFAIFALGCFLLRFVVPGDNKFVQEIAVPIFFFWVALDWIGLALALKKLNREPRARWEWLRLAALAVWTISLPAIVLPISLADFGSLLPVLAILFPLAAVLLLSGSTRFGLRGGGLFRKLADRRAGLAAVFAILVLFGGGYYFYENVMGFIDVPIIRSQGKRLFPRLLNFKYGTGAQRWALVANSFVGGEGMPYQELLNGNQHTWEDKAIAHFGGWTGEGYGKAPTRLSQVRQDTLQYDSAFSFFVVSEYGFVGGALLLMLYALPLVIVLVAAREHFDAGYALAVVVASAFFIEALYHAGMNWGAFPMTGRNLPLLSVNSPSDLFRWTILFGFALQNIFWRYKGSGRFWEQASSLLPEEEDEAPAPEDEADSFEGAPVTGWRLAACGLVVLLFPLLTFGMVLWSGAGVARDKEKELEVFSYEPLLKGVKAWLDSGYIVYAEEPPEKGKRLIPRLEKLDDPDAREFILQEIYRFNARNPQGRLEDVSNEQAQIFHDYLAPARDLRAYDRFLEKLRGTASEKPRPSIFRLDGVRDRSGKVVDYKVVPNEEFNVRFMFRQQDDDVRLPQVSYGGAPLIAPVWLNGHYTSAVAPSASPLAELPWIEHLTRAMESEWRRVGRDEGAQLYGKLTLDRPLQEAAQRFAASKGLGLHEKNLAGPASDYEAKYPPRVAISVIGLPDGKVYALGGWPRMTSSGGSWARVEVPGGNGTRAAWIPSAAWLEEKAPVELRRRYEGDRNFDRAMVMGSSTKPLWASAVLKIHPRLDSLLRVLPDTGEENEAFGLAVPGEGWDIHTRVKQWINFDQFLTYSDNRYQVRMGLLGLAAKDGDRVKLSQYKGSPVESVSGQNKPEGKEPEFTPAVQIRRDGPKGTLVGLDLADTELSRYMHNMYSIGVKGVGNPDGNLTREFLYRRSFWTLNERDDSERFRSDASVLLNFISPQVPDFYLDKLTDPRQFVNMLLGGLDNRWANVDLAAAFGSCVTGHPVLAHIVEGREPVRFLPERQQDLDPKIAAVVRRGLNGAVERDGGTARSLGSDPELAFLKQKVKFYAKTGTLEPRENANDISRIVFAAVRWKDEGKGEVAAGLVFAVVAENSDRGVATGWLRDFIVENKSEISKLLGL
ncbi:MAG: FtsW/RodA/SpoVE family cell cycle protein [Acidobacteria bacterium]|nr:FtsW/RodA/SpoVE family cell cycle protein [Acidobacteriota bacterium]